MSYIKYIKVIGIHQMYSILNTRPVFKRVESATRIVEKPIGVGQPKHSRNRFDNLNYIKAIALTRINSVDTDFNDRNSLIDEIFETIQLHKSVRKSDISMVIYSL